MPRRLKKIIHINQHVIKANRATGERNPVITCKTSKSNDYAHRLEILGADGAVVATVRYEPDKPLSCGAHVWIETTADVRVAA